MFSVIGPALLLIVGLGRVGVLDTTLLDIFKIWLGAAIGISTSLLQRDNPAPVAAATPKQ